MLRTEGWEGETVRADPEGKRNIPAIGGRGQGTATRKL